MKRVLYVQYTNPAGYPALQRSATLLARAGFEVLFAGIESIGTQQLQMQAQPNVRLEMLGGPSGGSLGPAKYAAYLARVANVARKFRPNWCYASDLLSAPAALLVRRITGARVVYHEHDAPTRSGKTFLKAAFKARGQLVDSADVVVIPSEQRRALLPERGAAAAQVVWNCPLREEVSSANAVRDDNRLRLVYAGSLSTDRLPLSYIEALALLPATVTLDVYGYYTVGQERDAAQWRERIAQPDVADRVRMHGTVSAHELPAHLRQCDVGIATILNRTNDINLNALAGASNKAFDYMAAGLPMLVSDTPEWRRLFVDNGYAVTCNAADPQSIAAAVRGLLDPAKRRAMGDSARARIRSDWNYQTQFAAVLARMSF